MISVGGMELHRGVFWTNEKSTPRVSEEVFPDIDGVIAIQRGPLTGGRLIVLEAEGSDKGSRGIFTRAQVDQIETWEITGEQLTFIYGSISKTVVVPANPLAVVPLRKMYGHQSDDLYYGTITLMEVTQ